MTVEGAVSSALNGITAFSKQVGDISENLANVGTAGFKRVDSLFRDMLMGPSVEYATPVSVHETPIYRNNVAGTITSNTNPTSFAVSVGTGLVPVADVTMSGATETLSTVIRYTRAGDFSVDANNFLVNSQGQALMAVQETKPFSNSFPAAPNAGSVVPVNLDPAVYNAMPGTPTTSLSLNANFPAAVHVVPDPLDPLTPGPAPGAGADDQTLSVPFFDSLGTSHTLQLILRKVSSVDGTVGNKNTWNVVDAVVKGTAGIADTPVLHETAVGVNDTVSFGSDGRLSGNTKLPFKIPPLTDPQVDGTTKASAVQTLTIDLGTPTLNSTQFAGTAIEIRHIQDWNGHAPGAFAGASIDNNGYVSFRYNNGLTTTPYRIPLATFPNPNLLERISGATFGANPTLAGTPTFSWSGEQGGVIVPSAVESSNVDVASELTKMVVAQKAYSSNSKVISVGDQMKETAINMKT